MIRKHEVRTIPQVGQGGLIIGYTWQCACGVHSGGTHKYPTEHAAGAAADRHTQKAAKELSKILSEANTPVCPPIDMEAAVDKVMEDTRKRRKLKVETIETIQNKLHHMKMDIQQGMPVAVVLDYIGQYIVGLLTLPEETTKDWYE